MKHILMVDDVATNLKCAVEVLKEQYEITTVRSGVKALEVLKNTVPDLILLDINMPQMSGFEVFEKIKEIPELSEIPVIFLTAETNKEVEEKGLKMGAVDFIRKPFEPDDLCGRIEKVIRFGSRSDGSGVPEKDKISRAIYKKNLDRLITKVNSEKNRGYLILLNVHNFRQIGELFGTSAEEEMLVRISRVMEEETGTDSCICHMRGDVFGIFLEDAYDKDKFKKTIRRIIAGIEFEINESIPEELDIKIEVSAGIACKPEDGDDFKVLYACADKALYFVLESGKGSYRFYTMKQSELAEAEQEKDFINRLHLKRQFQGRELDSADGQESLQKAYYVISRYWENRSREVQIIFFNVIGKENDEEKIMDVLTAVINASLRKGDVAVRCGRMQYLAVLINVTPENGSIAAERIIRKFAEKVEDDSIRLNYELRSV